MKRAGLGELKCYVYYSDGERAKIETHQLNKFIHAYKIYVDQNKSGLLNLFLAHEAK